MNHTNLSIWARAALIELTASAAVLALTRLLTPGLDLGTGQPFAALLTQWCSLVLLGCGAWAWAVTTVVVVEALRADGTAAPRGRRAGLPAAYRRLVLTACGIALSAGAAAPAMATPGPVHLDPRPAAVAAVPVVVPARAPLHLHPRSAVAEGRAAAITVRSGDSLWRLAAERLPHDAEDATIAHAWRRLYAANAALIGTDPDHIEPGQRLVQPRGW